MLTAFALHILLALSSALAKSCEGDLVPSIGDWKAQISSQPVTSIQIPGSAVPEIKGQLLKIPVELKDHPNVEVKLAYFAHEQAIVPPTYNSGRGHSLVRYLEGYDYLLTFTTPEERREFLNTFCKVFQADGSFKGDDGRVRYPLILTPAQFLALEEAVPFKNSAVGFDGFVPATWSQVKALPVFKRTYSKDTTYFFDQDGNVLGMARGSGKYFVFVPRESKAAVNYASHAAILARQRGLPPPRPEIDTGLSLEVLSKYADLEVDKFASQFDTYLGKTANAKDKAELDRLEGEIEKGLLKAESPMTSLNAPMSSLAFNLNRYLALRDSLLEKFNQEYPNTLAAFETNDFIDLAKIKPGELAQLPVEMRKNLNSVYRFVWIRGVKVDRAGLLLNRKGPLLHQQILRLGVGDRLYAVLLRMPELLRGGTLKIDFAEDGHAKNFELVGHEMHVPDGLGRIQTLTLDGSERSNFEFFLHNSYRDSQRKKPESGAR